MGTGGIDDRPESDNDSPLVALTWKENGTNKEADIKRRWQKRSGQPRVVV